MSAEAIAAAQAAPPPEVIGTPATPLERFASHVAWVREKGDAYDTRGDLWLKRGIQTGAGAGLSGGLTMLGEATEAVHSVTEAAVTVAVAGLAMWGVNRLREGRIRETAIRRIDAGTGVALNQRYELVRVTKRGRQSDIVMLWYGPYNGARLHPDDRQMTVAEALKEMAGMAEKCGIHSIAMSPQLEAAAIGKDDAKLPEMTVAQWLINTKGLSTSGRSNKEKVVSAAPGYWADYAANEEAHNQGTGVDAMLTQLEGLDYRHNAVRSGREYAADREWQRIKVKASLKAALEMQMGETAVSGPEDRHNTESYVRHDKQQATALIDGEDIVMFIQGRLVERTSIMQKLGLTEERLELLLQNKNPALRRERQQALEFALYRTLHRQEDAYVADGKLAREIREVAPPGKIYRYQVELAVRGGQTTGEKTSRGPQRRRVMTQRVLATLLTGVVASSGMMYGDSHYTKMHTAAALEIMQERGLASAADVPDAQIRERMSAKSGFNPVWHKWQGIREGLHNAIWGGDTPASSPATAGFGGGTTGVGNVDTSHPHTIWNLTPHNMDTDGYWMGDTWKYLQTCPPDKQLESCVGGDSKWVADQGAVVYEIARTPAVANEQTMPAIGEPNAKWMEVSGTVDRSEFQRASGDDAYLGLPMKPGSDLMGASFNGEPVKLVMRRDGTVAIDLVDPDKQMAGGTANIAYWFQPGAYEKNPHQYRYAGKETTGTTFYDYEGGIPQPAEAAVPGIDAIFSEYIPAYAAAGNDPNKKRQAVADFLVNDFKYSYTPISPEEAKRITDWKSFATEVLKYRIANCNVAGTIMALADPRLTAASGFLNGKGTGGSQLDSLERHLVNLDGVQLLDETPRGQFLLDQPGSNQPPESPAPWLILLCALQLAGVTLLTQRQARTMYAQHRVNTALRAADRAEQKLEAMGPFVLNLAAEAAGAAAWSPDGKVNVEHAINQAASKTSQGYAAARDRVKDPAFRDPGTLQRLQQQAWQSPAIQEAYKQATIAAKRPPHHRLRK